MTITARTSLMSFTIFWKNNESFVPNLYYSVLPFKVLFFEAIPAWCNKTYPIVFSQSSKHFSNSILDFSSVLLPYRNVSLSNFTFFFGKDKSHRARADKYGGGDTPLEFLWKKLLYEARSVSRCIVVVENLGLEFQSLVLNRFAWS